MPIAKEQIPQIIADNNIRSVADVYTLLRDSFKDILQEPMDARRNLTQHRAIKRTIKRMLKP